MAGYLSPAAYLYVEEQEYLQAYEDVLERYKGEETPCSRTHTIVPSNQFGTLLFRLPLQPFEVLRKLLFACFKTGFLCITSGCPGTHYVDQAGLEVTETHLPLPPKHWD